MTVTKIIWLITDNKRGHENQSLGLIRALERVHPIQTITLSTQTYHASWLQAICGKLSIPHNIPSPDLIIGTGRRTHSTILAAGRKTGAPTIVLMTPPIGTRIFFDLCIAPEHDEKSGSNLIYSKGALNIVQPGTALTDKQGLILIGGPSANHAWNEAKISQQVQRILSSNPTIKWTLTTSRRTPPTTTQALSALANSQLQVEPVEQTSADWLQQQLNCAGSIWVTEDSVSMVYEALTSGSRVGILNVPRKSSNSRVVRGLDKLICDQMVHPYEYNHADLLCYPKNAPLNEANRIAQMVLNRFLK